MTSQNEAPDELLFLREKSILGQKRHIYRPHNQPVDQRVGPVMEINYNVRGTIIINNDNATCSPCSVLNYT
jgi:hypothetical protein